MKHRIVTLSVCLCIAAAFAAARVAAGQYSQPPKTHEITVTGCVVQGTEPTVFLLENAKADPRDSTEKGRSYLLVSEATSISFREHLNHEVKVSGTAEMKMPVTPPEGQRAMESDLPKLTATKVIQVASTCSSPQG